MIPRPARPVLALAAVVWAAFIARCLFFADGRLYSTLFDDAMVSMRYARNWADGHGLVWNAGGLRVQGFTDPLWTFLMCGVHLAGVPTRLAALMMMTIGALMLFLASVSAWRLARSISDRDDVANIAAALTAFAYPLMFWTLRGMEVGLLACLLTAAAHRAILYARQGRPRDLQLTSVLLICLLWTRADGLVSAGVVVGYMTLVRRSNWRAIALFSTLIAIVGVAGPIVFSRTYYGPALPNTYYLKLEGVGAVARMARGLPALVVVAIRSWLCSFVVIAALAAAPAAERRRRELTLLAGLFAAQCAYSVFVGGDAWEWMGYANRYVAIALPLLGVLTAIGIAAAVEHRRFGRWGLPAFSVLIAAHAALLILLLRANRAVDATLADVFRAQAPRTMVLIVAAAAGMIAVTKICVDRRSSVALTFAIWLTTSGVPAARWAAQNAFLARQDMRAARFGLLIRDTLRTDAAYAVTWAGSTPYFGERTAIDLLGKSDPIIARRPPAIPEFVPGHNKWDLEYSIGLLKPDLACNLPGRTGEAAYLVAQGYHAIGGTCFVRRGARLDERRLVAGIARLDGAGRPRSVME
jgi:hypothetical protein